MTEIPQAVLNGVVFGSVLALLALGLTLAFGIARFANVAHGDLATLGAFGALAANQGLGWGMLPSAAAGVLLVLAAGFVAVRLVYRPLARRPRIAAVIASIGVALVVRHLIIAVWGTGQHAYALPIQRALRLPFGLRLAWPDLVTLAVAVALMAALHLLLVRTRLGQEMRAVADDPDLARVSGIDPLRVMDAMWVVALALAGVAGVLVGVKTIVGPYIGWDLLLAAFAGAILGGIGNPYGAMAGGLVIGVAEEVSTLWLPPAYRTGVAFLLMTAVLLARPSGIFGTARVVR
jgi:branched-subunit amino acid ABC-type transport system permease component